MISIVIPVYRSELSLVELHDRIANTLHEIAGMYEVIFVEDCGGDGSWEIIQRLSHQFKNVRGIQMSRNFGQHNALLCGIREAKGDLIITMDDDLQHPPEVLPELLKKLGEGFDVVYGYPQNERHSFIRNLASLVTKLVLQKGMGAENARFVSALRVFRSPIRQGFAEYRGSTVNIDVLLTWSTTQFGHVLVPHEDRRHGVSGYTWAALIKHALNMITGFSAVPLQVASLIGFGFSVMGLLVLIYVILGWISHGSVVPGFAFIASLVAIFSGAQLLALGLMGEYLARIYFRSLDQPSYLIKTKTFNNFE